MMTLLVLLVLLVLIVIFLLRLGVLQRLSNWAERRELRASELAPRSKGQRHLSGARPEPQRLRDRVREFWELRGRAGQIMLSIIGLTLVLLMLSFLPSGGATGPRPGLSVAIAPFSEQASQTGTGAAVARELVSRLTEDADYRVTRPLHLALLSEPLDGAKEAVQQASESGYDVVIWGQAEPGAMADSSTLDPYLLFLPRTPPPARWPDARERLILPPVYDLGLQPLNALAVLGPLLDALDLYQQGDDLDRTVALLTDLRRRYEGALSPTLPATLLGTIRWAQGDLAAAEAEFRLALDTSPGDPVLWNNLGLVLQERGDLSGARAAFDQSLQLAAELGDDFAAARFNRALMHLSASELLSATQELQRAVELRPGQVPLLVSLAIAQRSSGDFATAGKTLDQALKLDPAYPPALLEASRLRLARLVGDGAHIEWGLERSRRWPLQDLTAIRTQIDRAIRIIENQMIAQQQAATRNDARRRLEAGRFHEAMARRLEAQLNEARYWQALVRFEEGREEARIDESALRSFWDALSGEVSAVEQAEQAFSTLVQRTASYPSRYQLGRIWRFSQDAERAEEQFKKAAEQDPARPEAHYGLATLLWSQHPSQERDDQLRTLLEQAIAADEQFYPARRMLAALEMQSERWEAALEQLDWLVTHRPQRADIAIDRGQVLTHLDRHGEAEEQLLSLANQGNGEALVALALLYRDAGQDDDAEHVLQDALKLNKGNIDAAYQLALLYRDHSREQEAAALLEQAVRVSSASWEVHLLLGQLYASSLNKPMRAIEHYQLAIQAGGSNPRNFETLGKLFLEAGEPEQAVEALSRAVNLDPNVPEAHHALATAYLQLGEYDLARHSEETAIQKAPDGVYPEALAGIADSYRTEGDYKQAVQFYARALEQKANFIAAYIGLGRTAAAQGQWQIAIDHYKQALEHQPEHPQARYWLGVALLESGNYEAALKEFEAILLKKHDHLAEAYYGAGRASVVLGEQAEALHYFAEALRRRPAYGEVLLARGKLLEQQGRMEEAVRDYEAAAQADASLAEPLYRQGLIYIGRNNFVAAIEVLEQALGRQENIAEAHYWLGRAYRAQKQIEIGREHLQRAIELQPNFTEARYFLARTEEQLGHHAEAIAAYEVVLSQAPPDSPWRAEAQQALDRLR